MSSTKKYISILMFLLVVAFPNDVKSDRFRDLGVVPQILPNAPPKELKFYSWGDKMKPLGASPDDLIGYVGKKDGGLFNSVSCDGDGYTHYIFIVLDLDAPEPWHGEFSQYPLAISYRHGAYGCPYGSLYIPKTLLEFKDYDITGSEQIYRWVFLLYNQTTFKAIPALNATERRNFNIVNFAKQFSLILESGSVYRVMWQKEGKGKEEGGMTTLGVIVLIGFFLGQAMIDLSQYGM